MCVVCVCILYAHTHTRTYKINDLRMGNAMGSRKLESAAMAARKVVLSDGRVQNLKEETTVAEIMLENPQHVVVEFDPSSISFNDRNRKNNDGKTVKKKLTPLPADKTLEPGKIYLVLPAKRSGGGASKSSSSAVMTSEEIRKMLFSATAMVRSSFSYYEGILPWFTTRSYNNNPSVDAVVAATSVGRLEAETEEEGRPEFLNRQVSGRGWKPSLDPIKEKKAKKTIHQRLLF